MARKMLLAAFSCAISVAFAAANVGLARATTRTFSFTHTEQVFTVPAGVTSIHVIAIGGHGGNGDLASNNGGAAAMAGGDLGVAPGQTLYVEVGGVGGNGGFGSGTPSITLTYNTSSGAPSGERAAALASCKKRAHKHHWSHKRLKKCKRKAQLLPI